MKNRLSFEMPEQTGRAESCPPVVPARTRQQYPVQLEHWMSDIERFLADHPRTCLGIGLAVGVFLGCLTKRR